LPEEYLIRIKINKIEIGDIIMKTAKTRCTKWYQQILNIDKEAIENNVIAFVLVAFTIVTIVVIDIISK